MAGHTVPILAEKFVEAVPDVIPERLAAELDGPDDDLGLPQLPQLGLLTSSLTTSKIIV